MTRRALGVSLVALCASACAKTELAWRAELAAPEPFRRALAAIALAELVPDRADDATLVLLETIDRTELELSTVAEADLARVASASPRAVERLVTALVRDEFMTLDRRSAIERVLSSTGPRAAETLVAALRGGVRDESVNELLVRLRGDAVGVLVVLMNEGGPRELELHAATLLGRIGAPARDALPALRDLRARLSPAERPTLDATLASIERGN